MLERNGNMNNKDTNHPFIGKGIEINNVVSCKINRKIDDNDKINEEDEVISIFRKMVHNPDFFDRLSKSSHDEVRKEYKAILGQHFEDIPSLVQDSLIFFNFPGDNGRSIATKPDWFDKEKFAKGQAFACDNAIGLLLGQLYGLLCLICHEDGLRTLTMTKKSHTPYLAFDRYMSTTERVLTWYKEDPWKEGTKANRNIQIVRKMHGAARRKLCELNYDQIEEISTLKNPYCPAMTFIQKDFSLIPDTIESCLYNELMSSPHRPKGLNQVEMSYTLFGFMGIVILFPQEIGIHPKSDEELENFCHLWRTIGYLLGVDDDANFCRGSLEDVKERGREYLEFLVKPALQRITPQYEHMSRCILEGFGYFFPRISFQVTVLRIADFLNIEMPELYASLSYGEWFQYTFGKFFLRWGLRFAIIRHFTNKIVYHIIDKAINVTKAKREELKEKSRNSKLHVE